MLLESKLIKEALYKKKQELLILLDRTKQAKVRFRLEDRLSVIDYLFVWINEIEKGDGDMQDLKLGELTTWEPKPRKDSIDEKIIEDAKNLKKNYDAIKVTVDTVKWSTFYNRTYALNKEGKIDTHIVPRKDNDGTAHLVYLDDAPSRRHKRK